MSRDDLTPEHVTTKDGNHVIRWKKRDKKRDASTGNIPAPGAYQRGTDKEKNKQKKHEQDIGSRSSSPKGEKKAQKAARQAENARQWDYIKTEAKLRLRYKDNPNFSGSDVSSVLKALRESGSEDPESIVDEDLLVSYAEFTELAWKPYFENNDPSTAGLLSSESFRPHVTKLAAHYVTHPEDREPLARIVKRGIYDYDEATAALYAVH